MLYKVNMCVSKHKMMMMMTSWIHFAKKKHPSGVKILVVLTAAAQGTFRNEGRARATDLLQRSRKKLLHEEISFLCRLMLTRFSSSGWKYVAI